MDLTRWLSFRRRKRSDDPWSGVITRAALSGTATEALVRLSARSLLEAADADRAGVWLLSEEVPGHLEGITLERSRIPSEAEGKEIFAEGNAAAWATFPTGRDPNPYMEMLLAREEPAVVDLHKVPQISILAPLAGMRTAAWLPLRVRKKPLGLALVAYTFSALRQDLRLLFRLAEEAALAIAFARRTSSGPARENSSGQTERLAALGQLVSGIAHELNNPLTTIMGYAQLLSTRGSGDDSSREGLHHVYEEARRARRIVRNLLLFARDTRPERRPADLNEIVERTLALRSYELKVENITVELDLAPHLPHILADAHQLQQVVLNLIVNAEQAIREVNREERRPSEGVPAAYGEPVGHIRIRTRVLSGDRLALEVSDDGPGISPETAARMFDPFFTTKLNGQGTGLGLSIAYGIVQEHGGEIYPEGPPSGQRGTTLVVELPAAGEASQLLPMPEVGEPSQSAGEDRPAGRSVAAGRGARILVVEDEPTVARLVADVLGEEGHQVDAILDSREGLRHALSHPYDLLICDLKMPRLDGRAFYEALVSAGRPARQRMLFITGDTLGPRSLDFLSRNKLAYLGKPFLVEELKSIVKNVLESAGAAESDTADRSASGRESPQRRTSEPARLGGRKR